MSDREQAPRRRLSLPRVLDAAIGLIERDGVRALTMRALGNELGVEAMSLYRYVDSHDALIDAIVNRVVDQVTDRISAEPRPVGDWRTFLREQATAVRQLALELPNVFPLVATRTPSAPWVRPPVRSLRWIEEFLTGLLQRGFADDGAVAVYRAFTSFLLGHLLLEVSARGADTGPVPEPDIEDVPAPDRDELSRHPALSRLAGRLAEDRSQEEFYASLTSLLDRLERLRAQPQQPPPS